ncbi:unnamed protein product [Ilex paraguariensis]|uniref:Uncharacterized protein n=1 Tax=Ilex paraguariensis TaxID=185542 RepID=A0ABC8SPL6_9AQUA
MGSSLSPESDKTPNMQSVFSLALDTFQEKIPNKEAIAAKLEVMHQQSLSGPVVAPRHVGFVVLPQTGDIGFVVAPWTGNSGSVQPSRQLLYLRIHLPLQQWKKASPCTFSQLLSKILAP